MFCQGELFAPVSALANFPGIFIGHICYMILPSATIIQWKSWSDKEIRFGPVAEDAARYQVFDSHLPCGKRVNPMLAAR